MQKFRSSDIKSFEFSDLQGTPAVSKGDFKAFAFGELDGDSFNREKISEETLRSERTFEKDKNFKIDGIVRNSRGLAKQEQSDFEKRIEEEVRARLEVAYAEAYNEGLEKGREEGKAEAFANYEQELSAKVEEFVQIADSLHSQSQKLVESNRREIYEFVKRFTKWICLKEINERLYLETLLEKLVLELNARKNLTIKVGSANFAHMPEVIKVVEAKLGHLSNLRVEVVPEIQHPGIILESENGLIDGSIEGVFQNIDKIFDQVLRAESNKA